MSDHPAQEIPYPGSEDRMARVAPGRDEGLRRTRPDAPVTGATLPSMHLDEGDARRTAEPVEAVGCRAAQPDEIVPSCVLLASNRLSSYDGGEVLAPVGGQTMTG